MDAITNLQAKRALPGWTEAEENDYQECLEYCRVPYDAARSERVRQTSLAIARGSRARIADVIDGA